jgi:hypothetical protein
MIPLQTSNVHSPLSFDIGDTWLIEFECHDVIGVPLNLSGATIEWRLRDGDGNIILLLTDQTTGITVMPPPDLNTPSFQCVVTLTPAQTSIIPAGHYVDRLRITTAQGIVTTQSVGRIDAIAT